MENILSAFNSASSNVSKKVATTINEAKKTNIGVEIGLYSVEKNDDGYYDIRDNRTNDTLFEDLYIYETAFVITKHLNDGKKVNSDAITKVMSTNALFEHYYEDARFIRIHTRRLRKETTHIRWVLQKHVLAEQKTKPLRQKSRLKTCMNN